VVEKISKINSLNTLNSGNLLEDTTPTTNKNTNELQETSLFLLQKYNDVQDKQGFIGKFCDKVKNKTDIGYSSKDCENVIAKYEKGEVSLEEAMVAINKFDKKQNNATELTANIITGITAIAAATALATGPIGWGLALLAGAPVGLVTKVLIKMADRGTNKVDNDVLDKKEIVKDAVTGAVTGMTSAVSSGVAAGVVKGNLKLAVKNGTISGLECGAVAGATTYATDVALNKDKQFKFGDFLESTITSSLVSGSVGGIVGGGIYGSAALKGCVGAGAAEKDLVTTIVKDSTSSSSRKLLNRAERDVFAA